MPATYPLVIKTKKTLTVSDGIFNKNETTLHVSVGVLGRPLREMHIFLRKTVLKS